MYKLLWVVPLLYEVEIPGMFGGWNYRAMLEKWYTTYQNYQTDPEKIKQTLKKVNKRLHFTEQNKKLVKHFEKYGFVKVTFIADDVWMVASLNDIITYCEDVQ